MKGRSDVGKYTVEKLVYALRGSGRPMRFSEILCSAYPEPKRKYNYATQKVMKALKDHPDVEVIGKWYLHKDVVLNYDEL